MKKLIAVIALLLLAVNISTADDEVIETSEKFLQLLDEGNFEQAYGMFDEIMKSQLKQEQLAAMWQQFKMQLGEVDSTGTPRVAGYQEYRICTIPLHFPAVSLGLQITLNEAMEVAGFRYTAIQTEYKYVLPAYADTTKFEEIELEFGIEKYRLPARLVYPKNVDNFPVLILVHGSGPNDMDLTVGKNKPFKDLAYGLATKGIAVLRYDKRTKVLSRKTVVDDSPHFDLDFEVTDDVVAAEEFLLELDELNFKNRDIFILGHSLGGMMIPRISQRTNAAGYIISAGPARGLENLLLEQYDYIFGLDSVYSDKEREEIDKLKRNVMFMLKNELDSLTPIDSLPLGLSGVYWNDIKNYYQAEEAKKIEKPLLVLQYGRDYQVTNKDYELWREKLDGMPNVKFQYLEMLNHLMQYGTTASTPSEYNLQAPVDKSVIEFLAEWIKSVHINK
jgi:pimeloyl-ACP methyl ester carboxylesterase